MSLFAFLADLFDIEPTDALLCACGVIGSGALVLALAVAS